MNPRAISTTTFAVIAAFLSACAGPTNPLHSDNVPSTTIASDWERAFAPSDGWTGGDGLGTIALPGNRLLWLFGDSWIGPVRNGKHAPGSAMVNNAIALQRIGSNGTAPTTDPLQFLWGPPGPDGKPTAWVVPPPEEKLHDRNLRYWPAGGGIYIPAHKNRAPALYVFLGRVRDREEKDSVWNFEGCGTAIARIDNPGDPPHRWRMQQTTLTRLPESLPRSARRIAWGAAAIMNDSPDATEVYIFGVDSTNLWNKRLLLARAPCDAIDRMEQWSFYTAHGWSTDPIAAAPVADFIMDEFSISRLQLSGKPRYLMTYSKPILDDHIVARTAETPTGPWTAPIEVYRCPEPATDKRLFAYSAKAHPEVSRPGELLISYCVNSNDFWHMAANAWIYRPRFIRLPLASLDPSSIHLQPAATSR